MKSILIAVLIGVCLPLMSSAKTSADEVLLRSYIRFSLAQEVQSQAHKLAAGAPAASEAKQITNLADEWLEDEVGSLRADLKKEFGDNARKRFASFVAEFTAAEKSGNIRYLEQLSKQVGLLKPPSDYKSLRRLALDRWLKDQLAGGTSLLGEIQTWSAVSAKQSGVPPLDAWLERNQAATPAPKQARRRPANPLRAAEVQAPAWDNRAASSGSALDSFAQRRRARREQAMQTAQAGMQQMSIERQAAEQERAARVTADAQAEAEAMRAQAQKLAAVEAEALAQRENSWGNRIKKIVGSTIGAGVGAFTGGIGTQAGQRAADAVFK